MMEGGELDRLLVPDEVQDRLEAMERGNLNASPVL